MAADRRDPGVVLDDVLAADGVAPDEGRHAVPADVNDHVDHARASALTPGVLQINWVGRDLSDRLRPAVRSSSGTRTFATISTDETTLVDVEPGPITLMLLDSRGHSLASQDLQLQTGQVMSITFAWPTASEPADLSDLVGVLVLPDGMETLRERVRLEIVPLMDSEAQRRRGSIPKVRNLRRDDDVEPLLFTFTALPPGGYELKVPELGFSRKIQLVPESPSEVLVVAVDALAAAILTFTSADGARLAPEHVVVQPIGSASFPLGIVPLVRPDLGGLLLEVVPGRYRVQAVDPAHGSTTYQIDLTPGWSTHDLTVDPRLELVVPLAGLAADASHGEFAIEGLDGGRSIGYEIRRPFPRNGTAELVVSVDRPGHYRVTCATGRPQRRGSVEVATPADRSTMMPLPALSVR